MKRYFKVWFMLTKFSIQIALSSRFGAFIFTLGKMLRFSLVLFFLFVIFSRTEKIAGYSLWHVIFFFATFNLIDTISQLFLREVYRFRRHILSGSFDYYLSKPFSPLFRSLFGGGDILDIPLFFISLLFLFVAGQHIGEITFVGVLLYVLLLCNAFLITVAIHIFVLSIGILTTEVDNTLWVFRDLSAMGRVPVDIYKEPLQTILTYGVFIGIMLTFPGKALMGLLSPVSICVAFAIGIGLFLLSLKVWHLALKEYSSASS